MHGRSERTRAAKHYLGPEDYNDYSGENVSKWNPKRWSRGVIIGAIIAAIVIIVAIIVGAVVGSRNSNSAYPDYTQLNYTLQDTYHGTTFFDNFDYFNTYDPSQGFVHYVPEETAQQYNLTYATDSAAIMRVDTSTANATTGRFSVRITSKKQYNNGLFIFNVTNSPYGCSTWPALWLSDPSNWPTNGEIDVMEGVNQATNGNQMTLHTTDDCKMNVKRKETGKVLTTNCFNGTDDNAGCGVKGTNAATFGEAFNEQGGGTYAVEWRNAGIRIWFFQRGSEPSDIPTDVSNTTAPDPSTWSTPMADFPGTDCDISSHFKNQSIIADIDLCGSWAGATGVYSTQDQCPGTCSDFVAQNQEAYAKAFWEFASFRVYSAS
ncbi:glycoside hydrolase family 16 protein [Acrodontium crateriforme]|uniref:endo-1,3(4)-beta-glucanase n=1 Tax=Acrodontium crateriforme TaxID=150365 RepID=A0AAQ3M9J7_9PEZI|nr:glycoside hydrolase family 16 protein [Acrodontium crateriforme]